MKINLTVKIKWSLMGEKKKVIKKFIYKKEVCKKTDAILRKISVKSCDHGIT